MTTSFILLLNCVNVLLELAMNYIGVGEGTKKNERRKKYKEGKLSM